ncbi:hypothetical protein B0H21DRAFT_825351 [Amylocystis lapponica]|nr:hypothetical protein B0H21DRAFT_825351 [Amylocystis lapponica]
MSQPVLRAFEPQYETWPENTSRWDRSVNMDRTWAPSPKAELFSLPPVHQPEQRVIPTLPYYHQRRPLRRTVAADHNPFRQESSGSWLSTLFKTRRKSRVATREQEEDANNWPSLDGGRQFAKPADWRAYGYWARPRVNGVTVDNATPSSIPPNLSRREVEMVARSLRGPGGSVHPKNWIPRVRHPALPPRPSLWPMPPPSPYPPLRASDLQLNPFLEHRLFGRPPIIFDLRSHTHLAMLGEMAPEPGDPSPLRLYFVPTGPNGAQPATYPGVSRMRVTSLADDTFPIFPWPFTVRSQHSSLPVSVHDVMNALIANFEERMEQYEIDALSSEQQQRTERAFWERVNTMYSGYFPNPDRGFTRIDYLGDKRFFRGLEPDPDGEGFMLFLGSA